MPSGCQCPGRGSLGSPAPTQVDFPTLLQLQCLRVLRGHNLVLGVCGREAQKCRLGLLGLSVVLGARARPGVGREPCCGWRCTASPASPAASGAGSDDGCAARHRARPRACPFPFPALPPPHLLSAVSLGAREAKTMDTLTRNQVGPACKTPAMVQVSWVGPGARGLLVKMSSAPLSTRGPSPRMRTAVPLSLPTPRACQQPSLYLNRVNGFTQKIPFEGQEGFSVGL